MFEKNDKPYASISIWFHIIEGEENLRISLNGSTYTHKFIFSASFD